MGEPTDLPNFDKLWDYSKPEQTERAFREIVPQAERAGDRSYLLQLLSQIARAQGLQGRFEEAHATLNRAEGMLDADLKLARVRYLLERGRVFNSSRNAQEGLPFFAQAHELATAEKFSRFAIDAAHMMAIAEPNPDEQIRWNLKGIALAQADPAQRGWLWSLYNNPLKVMPRRRISRRRLYVRKL